MRDLSAAAVNSGDFLRLAKKIGRSRFPEKRIFEFVARRIFFEPTPKDHQIVRTAAATLRTRRGNCVDCSVLISAMLRANNISHRFRAVGLRQWNRQYTHVFIITNKGYILDTVPGQRQDGREYLHRLANWKGIFNFTEPYDRFKDLKVL